MKEIKRALIFILIAVALLSGCGEAEDNSAGKREVTTQAGGLGHNKIYTEGLKESGMVFEDVPMEFSDPVMEEMLRNMIGKPEGEVYISELQVIHIIYWSSWENTYSSNVQSFDGSDGEWKSFSGKQPANFDDLAYCYNLQELTIGKIEVPSLEPLYKLPQLESLRFDGSIVTTERLEEIGNLPHISIFRLEGVEWMNWGDITDGSFLLPIADQITYLHTGAGIDWNPEVMAQMENLEVLFMEYQDDISFLEHMPKLKRLWLYCCQPEDWTPLVAAQSLEFLHVGGNMHQSIDFTLEDVKPLINLERLSLNFTTINKENTWDEVVEAMPGLTALQMLKF